jgi:hypothetical protein
MYDPLYGAKDVNRGYNNHHYYRGPATLGTYDNLNTMFADIREKYNEENASANSYRRLSKTKKK